MALPIDNSKFHVGLETVGNVALEQYIADKMKRREVLIIELRHIEETLGLEQRVQAVCPNCLKKWNTKPQ